MGDLKLVYSDTKIPNSALHSWSVSIKKSTDAGLVEVPSLSEMVGVGNCYGHALERLVPQLDDYIATLIKFRDEIVNTDKAYTTAIEVDEQGKLIELTGKEYRSV